jgi:hypothetical protein
MEWLTFVNYHVRHLQAKKVSLAKKRETFIRSLLMSRLERKIKRLLARSGLCDAHTTDMKGIVRDGSQFIDTHIVGEILLVLGGFFQESGTKVHGVLNVGPFACLPTRIVESILNQESQVQGNDRIKGVSNYDKIKKHHTLPYLSVEMDGNPLPQVVEARLEAFALQVDKVYRAVEGDSAISA